MFGAEARLARKARRFIAERRGIRSPKTLDVFRPVLYIFPGDLSVENYPRRPVAAFNPGAVVEGGSLRVFPRLIFDYYNYTSSIGFFELPADSALEGRAEKPLKTKVVLWPRKLWEFRGCEDARVSRHGDEYFVLYTGFGYRERDGELERSIVQGFARLDSGLNPTSRAFFTIASGSERFVPQAMKDCAFVEVSGNRAVMLARPTLEGLDVCWRAEADLSEPCLLGDTMEPVLAHEDWEFKVGWSTNTVRLSSNEYLVGWHGVLKKDYSYRNGLAIVDDQGELLAISDYLLAPKGIVEEYGDRPLVIFGDGLVKYKDYLVWVGGLSDYAIGVFAAELDKALEHLKWLKG